MIRRYIYSTIFAILAYALIGGIHHFFPSYDMFTFLFLYSVGMLSFQEGRIYDLEEKIKKWKQNLK